MVVVVVGLEEVIDGGVSVGAVVLGTVVPALVGGGAPRVGRMEMFFLRNDMDVRCCFWRCALNCGLATL